MRVHTLGTKPIQGKGHIGRKLLGIVGSRSLGYDQAGHVGDIVDTVLDMGYHIATGGAIGTDHYVLERLMDIGRPQDGTIFSAWSQYPGFPAMVRGRVRQFKELGGHLVWGLSPGKEDPLKIRVALLARNHKLVEACHGIIAFITGGSRGTIYTIKKAVEKRKPLVVFPVSSTQFNSSFDSGLLPELSTVKWVPLRCGGAWEGAFKAVYLR
jgi:hypothetical protein